MRPFELLIILLEAESLLFERFCRLELKNRAIIVHFVRLLMLLPPCYPQRGRGGTLVWVIRRRGKVGSRFEGNQVRIYLIKVYELGQ